MRPKSQVFSRRAILAAGSTAGLVALSLPSFGRRGEAAACDGDKAGAISGNHGHVATLTESQIAGPAPLTVSIKGTSTHGHDITLAEQDLLALKEGRTVTVRSTVAGHAHDVTFNVLKDVAGVVALNHGHIAVIAAADLGGNGSVTLHIMGSGLHDHQVELTPLEIRAIRAGWRLEKLSSEADGHDHVVTFN